MDSLNFIQQPDENLELFGSRQRRLEETDLRNARTHVETTYPLTGKEDCTALQIMLDKIIPDIRHWEELMAAGEQHDTGTRYLSILKPRKVEIEQAIVQSQCAAIKEAAEKKEATDSLFDGLSKVKKMSENTGKTSTWLIYGMIGLVVLVSGIIIVKKLRD